MKNILVTGAAGQIGSELIPVLRARYGTDNVIAGLNRTPLSSKVSNAGPSMKVDITNISDIEKAVDNFEIDYIFHMSTFLSALAENNPQGAFGVNIAGLTNVLDVAVDKKLEGVMVPSSIAVFGSGIPTEDTPNDVMLKPTTLYGIAKVYGELLGNYYFQRYGLDVRGLRLPGIVSCMDEMPTNGTTDYAVQIFYGAVQDSSYTCFLKPDTRLPMVYMPDAVKALIDLAECHTDKLVHRTDFNVTAMSFTPSDLAREIRKKIPDFVISYDIDTLRQSIADSWPSSLDDSAARLEWGWHPDYDITSMVDEMLSLVSQQLNSRPI